jgi:non-ribosomal peptide synthetase component F
MRRLAGGLQRHGVGPGDLVGLCLPRSSDLVVAMLGVMRTGAAAVPVDPNGPVQRVVEDLSVRLVLTDSRHTGLISGAPRVKMDRLRLRESEPGFDDARPDLPACVLSTDRRAVRIGHSALVNLLPAGFGTALELLRPLMTGETVSLRPVPLARPPVARRWDLADAAQHAS